MPSSISISFDVEPIVKLLCMDDECVFNLALKPGGWFACNLKHVTIEVGGVCADRKVPDEAKDE